ncbi:MAG: VWA domain-containing protein [Eggerthellaceae bacterium]|nr:VWA domain-containing protein [Eggerthellaceae bacterium]
MDSYVGILDAFGEKSNGRIGTCRIPINRPLWRITAVIGISMWLPSLLLYQRTVNHIGRPVVIGLLFLLLYFAVVITVFLTSKLTNNYIGNVMTMKDGIPRVLLMLLSGLALTFSLGALLEWAYEHNIDVGARDPTSYIFVIDDSGSMSGNDPEQRRYAAISDVLDEVDPSFPFMVYEFASDVSVLRKMAPVSEGIPAMQGMQDGGTAMKAALNAVLDGYERGDWSGGNRPKVILLSDGAPTDLGFLDTLNAEMK